jgi:hypothetical protein
MSLTETWRERSLLLWAESLRPGWQPAALGLQCSIAGPISLKHKAQNQSPTTALPLSEARRYSPQHTSKSLRLPFRPLFSPPLLFPVIPAPPRRPNPTRSRRRALAMYADRSSGRKRSVRDRLGSGGGSSRSRSDGAKRCARPLQLSPVQTVAVCSPFLCYLVL